MRDSFVDGLSCQEGCSNLNSLYCGEQKSISHRLLLHTFYSPVSEESEAIIYYLFIHPTWTMKAIFKLK